MAENNKIPGNAEKVLFAEDLMNYMMRHTVEATCTIMVAERYRNFIHNAFNDTIRKAVTFLHNKVDMENEIIFSAMLGQHSVNISTYTTFAKNIIMKYFTDGFDASCFLHFCASLAGMAVNFYNHGVAEAPDLAIMYIINVLEDVDMTTGGWDTLNTVGVMFSNIENDTVKQLSPESTSDEEASSSHSERNLNNSSASYPILIRVGSSSYLNEDFKEHEVPIKKVLNKDYHQRFNSSSSSENEECCKEFKECCPTSSVNSSKFRENKVVRGSLSPDTFAPGTSNNSVISVPSRKNDNLDLSLKDTNHSSAQNVSPLTSEKESSMLEITSKSKNLNSGSEGNNFPNKKP